MSKLKYAGLCAAGIVLNVACEFFCLFLIMQVFIGNPYEFIPYLIGFVLSAAAGFVHVLLLNIIRKKLGMKIVGYSLAVFVVPMGLAILGVIIPFAANMSICDGMPMLVYSGAILPVTIVSGISTLCFSQHFDAPEPALPDTEENSPIIEAASVDIENGSTETD